MSHIALLLPDLEVGGAQRIFLLLAKAFVGRGHKVDLIVLSSSGPLISEIPKGVNVVDLSLRNFLFGQVSFIVTSVFCLSTWMRKNHPDVLLSTITGANLVALIARKVSGVSVRLVIREAVTLKNIASVIRLRAMAWLYPQADAVVALTPFMKQELIEKVGVLPNQISCIVNSVDVEFIIKQSQVFVDHPWLNDDRLRVVISVGRLIPQKDYGTLIKAFALLSPNVSARLVIVGEGPERPMLERLMVELGIEARVQLVGFESNPWRWLSRADLFVLCSKWEGHPNALIEALVIGLPVVVTEYDDSIRELASLYNIGLVDVADEKMLARSIEERLSVKAPTKKYILSQDLDGIVEAYLSVLDASNFE